MTGIGLGIAPGAAVAGRLIDEYGASAAYSVPAVGGALAAVIAALTPWRTRRASILSEETASRPRIRRPAHPCPGQILRW